MQRLFFALWPDARVRTELQALAASLPLPNARLLAPGNTHMTLAFLGNVDDSTSAAVTEAANAIHVGPFSLRLDNPGWWKKPKIAWIAPSSYPDALPQLAEALQLMCRNCGVSMEERAYRPHLTLARKVTSQFEQVSFEPISWNINEFCLIESKSRASGVEYQVKLSWPLKIM